MRFLPVVAAAVLIAAPAHAQQFTSRFFRPGTPIEEKVKAVLPAGEEEAYQKIPWRLSIAKAREDAQRENKPLFIWVMNGHPLCGT